MTKPRILLIFLASLLQSSEPHRPFYGPVKLAKLVSLEDGKAFIKLPDNLQPGEKFMIEGMGDKLFKAEGALPKSFAEQLPTAIREETDLKK